MLSQASFVGQAHLKASCLSHWLVPSGTQWYSLGFWKTRCWQNGVSTKAVELLPPYLQGPKGLWHTKDWGWALPALIIGGGRGWLVGLEKTIFLESSRRRQYPAIRQAKLVASSHSISSTRGWERDGKKHEDTRRRGASSVCWRMIVKKRWLAWLREPEFLNQKLRHVAWEIISSNLRIYLQ